MKFGVILSISKTHLLSRKKQTAVAALGVTFGIGAYVIMMSFMTGLNGLLDGLVLNRTPHVRLYNELEPSESQPIENAAEYSEYQQMVQSVKPKQSQERIHNALAIISYLKQQKNVKGITPVVRSQGFYLAGSTRLSASLQGVNPLKEVELYNLDDYIVQGKAEDLATNDNAIILGIGAAELLSISVGDMVQIANVTGEVFPLKVVAFYQSGLADIDKVQSYINIKTAQRLRGESTHFITDINVKLYNMDDAPEVAKDLEKLFGINAVTIQEANAQFETGAFIRNLISYAVSITLLIVAGFGIYNILNMLIYEKMNDIAILKATGFSGKDVRLIFLSQAVLIGFIGGILGLLLGYGVSVLISNVPFDTEALPTIKTYPINFDPTFYIVGIVFALISTFLAGYLPSRKAQMIDPVEIIRGQ